MKKLLFFTLIMSVMLSGYSQGDWCGTQLNLENLFKNDPELRAKYESKLSAFNKIAAQQRTLKSGQILYRIPLVIHNIHYNGDGLISKTQIDDGIRVLNEDFNKRNADTTSVRNIFKPHIADFQMEFVLATKDPVGNPTNGIKRINSHLTYGANNSVKSLSRWDPFSYLNVWIVKNIDIGSPGTTLGYAQMPASGSTGFGLVVRADEWGSIEVAQSADGRTVTHEIGHCFTLEHTFSGGCGSWCHASGDFVCDTPPQFDDNNNSCNFNLNTCSNDASGGIASRPNPYTTNVPDQLENYMGYGDVCLAMFTNGQKARVHAAISNELILDSITSTYNEIQTGINVGHVAAMPKPIVEIFDFDKFACPGGSITFNENSYGGPLTTYQWTFPGGSPSSSTSANPTITYANPGNYDVKLKVSNAAGSDSVLLTNYVHINTVGAKYSAFNYNESFEDPVKFNGDWVIIDEYFAPTLERSSFTSFSGSACLWINNNASVFKTSKDQAISPSLKMSDVINPSVSMEIAYRRRNSSNTDKVNVKASLDCGKTWISLITMTPAFFAFDNATSSGNFVPASQAQWKTVTIPAQFINSAVKTGDNVKFMIEVEYGGGNNIWIDNFRINGQASGIENRVALENDFILYPNPASDIVNITVNPISPVKNAKIYVQNVVGKTVKEVFNGSMSKNEFKFVLNTNELSSGIYFVTTVLDGKRMSKKLIVR
ncbi:MAG: PKD domain-containing protein [Bacteroidetes bacterium]|nr:PKD domain-containing protein [Bacteroidota bacterium]MCB0802450.1 PKD domain-containing protein [Flavobacteriales bacterium]NOG56647.1 PKD domain-containing protein [Bacteroidota bacterium]